MAAKLFQLNSVFFSFSAFFAVSAPLAFISDPRILTPESSSWKLVGGTLSSPLHSNRHLGANVRLQAWLDNHNSSWNFLKCSICKVFVEHIEVCCAYTGKLDTQGNLSLCSVKRNVKSYIYIARTKLDNSVTFCWLFFILPMFLSFSSTHVQKLM